MESLITLLIVATLVTVIVVVIARAIFRIDHICKRLDEIAANSKRS